MWSDEPFLTGYLIINTDLKFNSNVQYPSIPYYIDKTTVYPLSGSSFLTGPEYILARNQGWYFKIKSAFYIQPKEVLNVKTNTHEVLKPFDSIIQDLPTLRNTLKDTSTTCYTKN